MTADGACDSKVLPNVISADPASSTSNREQIQPCMGTIPVAMNVIIDREIVFAVQRIEEAEELL